MIVIKDKEDCCGCNACGDICPKQAITFKTDLEGFWYPEVNMDRCIDCGLCDKICPIINITDLKKNDLPQAVCYAAEHKNLEVVFDSTSGGVFSALADSVYRSEGYVGGAIFNEDFSVRQYISNDKSDLVKLRSSKYLQSNAEGFYCKVRDLVKSGEKVLACGTPCQMAALRAFLKKDYENLLIADFICLGVNSPKVWRKYLDSFEERYGHKVVYCKAKSKEYGWRNLTQKVILDNGKEYFETKSQSKYTQGYLKTRAYCRPSCYTCKFKGYPRIADITLADFWGIEKIDKSMEKDLGTSLVMINSKKGETFFERIKSHINYIQLPFESSIKENPALITSLGPPLVDRHQFFEDLDHMSFTQLSEKYILPQQLSFKSRLTKRLRPLLRVYRSVGKNPISYIRLLRYNSIAEILRGDMLIVRSHCVLDIHRTARIEKHGISVLGHKVKFSRAKLETRLFVGKNAHLYLGPNTSIGYGADIEVFDNATLKFEGEGASNIGLTIICGEHVKIGRGVMIGRNVTIRDNNGGHYLNRPGYRDTRPVIIGEKAWICELALIMPGVKVGFSGIVGACAFVCSNVAAHTVVSGNPAQVIDEEVLWKY